jgi:hypothetical protein
MRTMSIGSLGLAAMVAVTLAAAPALAQGPKGGGMGPRYDKTTETTVTGTVDEVQSHQGRGGGTGLHLALKTEAGVLNVHVGPTTWLTEHNYAFSKGDVLQVTGSKVQMNGGDAFIAREIRKGDAIMTLRTADGVPLWSGGGARTQ